MPEQPFYVFGPGEGEHHEARGSHMFFKATAETTGGRFSLMERSLPPGGRMPPPHVHVDCEEAYYVLDGQVTFVVDGSEMTKGPGTFVLVLGGTGHTFGNRSAGPARLLVLHSPALDAYFAELEALWQRATPPTVEEERALMNRHSMRPAEG
jgi:uncharacterized cupin superfamily protein